MCDQKSVTIDLFPFLFFLPRVIRQSGRNDMYFMLPEQTVSVGSRRPKRGNDSRQQRGLNEVDFITCSTNSRMVRRFNVFMKNFVIIKIGVIFLFIFSEDQNLGFTHRHFPWWVLFRKGAKKGEPVSFHVLGLCLWQGFSSYCCHCIDITTIDCK